MKHVDQAFPQRRGAFDVEGAAQRTMVRASPPTTRGTPSRAVREFPASPRLVIAVMVFPFVSDQAIGPATRKNTAHVNTIHFRDTVFTLQ